LLVYSANYVWGLLLVINFLKLSWNLLYPPPGDGIRSSLVAKISRLQVIYFQNSCLFWIQ